MIAKIGDPRGERPGGLIYYLVGPGRREEHVDPHLVAGCDFRRLNGLLRQPRSDRSWLSVG